MKSVAWVLVLMPVLYSADAPVDVIQRITEAAGALHGITSTPDSAIPQQVLDDAQCVGVFAAPGRSRRGFLVCRTGQGWSGPAAVTFEGGRLEPDENQTELVLVVQNMAGARQLIDGAGGMPAAVMGYSRIRGSLGSAELQGAVLVPDDDANRGLYGRSVTQTDILTGRISVPAVAGAISAELNRYAGH